MGLTIHWTFHLPPSRPIVEPDDSLLLFDLPPADPAMPVENAEQALESLRAAAMDLGFAEVSEICHIECEPAVRGSAERWMWDGAHRSVEVDGERVEVRPLEVIGFAVSPGDGFETACFWLARYPLTVAHPRLGRGRVRTGLTGWHSHDFCKTQYASNSGMENFVRGHTSLVRVLDLARQLGFLADVRDEGHFWTRRSAASLAAECDEWNRMLAGFFGGLRDALGGGSGPIFEHPAFERLEAEGRTGSVAAALDCLEDASADGV